MTSDGRQENGSRSELQLKIIGFLLAIALSILGWGFNNWSSAVESGMARVMEKLERIESRGEVRDERFYELSQDVRILHERQNILRERVDQHTTHP